MSAITTPVDETNFGIYIHVPYCASRCDYCNFYTAGSRIADWPAFREAILGELESRLDEIPFPPGTIYFGGGTPSQMPEEELKLLLKGIRRSILEEMSERGCEEGWDPFEITLEANPDDVSGEKIAGWLRAGINRISMGVQSFSDSELKMLGRRHDSRHVEEAWKELKGRFQNLSIDLIFGIPGQSLEDWERNLHKAVEMAPKHISCYSLSYEERTALRLLRDRGERKEADDTDVEAMFASALRILRAAGYRHYEVSNFAIPGYESSNNSNYWNGGPYIGLGPSACSYDGRSTRRTNAADVKGYISDKTDCFDIENLSRKEILEEYILTRLRREKGIDMRNFFARFGKEQAEALLGKASQFEQRGLLKLLRSEESEGAERIQVEDAGWMLLDSIIVGLMPE